MDLLQAWLIVGVPALVVTAGLFSGHSRIRSMLGYIVLAGTLVFFLTVTGDVISSAVVGLVGFVLVANGRGAQVEERPEEHEHRKRYTTDPSHA